MMMDRSRMRSRRQDRKGKDTTEDTVGPVHDGLVILARIIARLHSSNIHKQDKDDHPNEEEVSQ